MKRKTGKLNKKELMAWQKRRGLTVDGIFGNESMGEVRDMERQLGLTNKEDSILLWLLALVLMGIILALALTV